MDFAFSHPLPPVQVACQQLVDGWHEQYELNLTCLWSLNPIRRNLTLLASRGQTLEQLADVFMACDGCFAGEAVERQRITHRPDVRNGSAERACYRPELVHSLGLQDLISVPILNSANPNQVLYVVNLFPTRNSRIGAAFQAGGSQRSALEYELYDDAKRFAPYIESCLQQACQRAALRLQVKMSQIRQRTIKGMCHLLAATVAERIHCDIVAVFVETSDATTLALQGNVGDVEQLQQLYNPCAEIAERTCDQNRELVNLTLGDDPQYLDTLTDHYGPLGRTAGLRHAVFSASVPLRDPVGQAKGTVICLNICGPGASWVRRPFTYEDVAVVEAIGQAFMPQLEILLSEQKRLDSMRRVAHELRVPVTAFRAALELVTRECQIRNVRFTHDYLDDLLTYSEMMKRILNDLEVLRTGVQNTGILPHPTYFEKDILAPARRFVQPIIKRRGFANTIRIIGLYRVPRLHVDRELMIQVVFNLLDNAIKFAYEEPDAFLVEIEGSLHGAFYEIAFRDKGVGIPPGFEERIFEEGIRGPDAHLHSVNGDGIGLFLGRGFVRLHGGDLVYRRDPASDWTEFVIRLPRALADGPPTKVVTDAES